MLTSNDLYRETLELVTEGRFGASDLNAMPTFEIRQYHRQLVEMRKEQREAQEAAREGRQHTPRRKLGQPLAPGEMHGADPRFADRSAPAYQRNRIENEDELSKRRRERIAELSAKKPPSDAAIAEAERTGRPLSLRDGKFRPVGTHGVASRSGVKVTEVSTTPSATEKP